MGQFLRKSSKKYLLTSSGIKKTRESTINNKMITVGILWIFAISFTTANAEQDVLPTFMWHSIDPPKLMINFNDGGDPDFVALERVHSEFVDDAEDEEDDECILVGNLVNEPDVAVTVDGCPGNETFQVIVNSERITEGTFEIDNGQVTAFHSDPDLMSASVDDEFEDDRYLPETYWTAEEREISDRSVPKSFNVTLSIMYDNNFLNNVCSKDKNTAKKRVQKVVDLAQTYFKISKALGAVIYLNVKQIAHINDVLKLTQGSAIQQSMGKAGKSAKSSKLDVDNYHFFSQEDSSTQGIAGVARKGTLCDTRKMERIAITEYTGKATKSAKDKNWAKGKLQMAQTFAHELGHSLNMPHDIKGKSCLKVAGMMSYKQTKTTWSTCSKEALAKQFAIMQGGKNKNIKNCKKGNSGSTATTKASATTKATVTTTTAKSTSTGCVDKHPSNFRCSNTCAELAKMGDCSMPYSNMRPCFSGKAPKGKRIKDFCKKSCKNCSTTG